MMPDRIKSYFSRRIFARVADVLIARTVRRRPDFVIGGHSNPYLLRWHLIPRNPVFNIYLHKFLRDDDDRALHDHPWSWCSILLRGCYIEHTIAAGGVHRRNLHQAPSICIAGPRRAHRIELLPNTHNPANAFDTWPRLECWTLFITGPRMREWGFHCPERGWVPWKRFTAPDDPGAVGPGCGDGS